MFDHEYTLVVHPRLRARLSYRRDDDDLAAATVRFDYRRDDQEWTEAGTAVELPDHPEESGIEWQGLHVSVYRDGERVLAREFSSSLLSDALDAVDAIEEIAPSVARRGKNAASRVAGRRGGGRIEMPQLDGETVEALRPPAKATFEVYEGSAPPRGSEQSSGSTPRDGTDGKWRWRLLRDDGNVIADSGRGYSSRRSAENGIRSVKRNALGAPVEAVGGNAERDVRSASDTENEGSESGTAES
jgi:uncharacterized protein YegP (UPF0339 family)